MQKKKSPALLFFFEQTTQKIVEGTEPRRPTNRQLPLKDTAKATTYNMTSTTRVSATAENHQWCSRRFIVPPSSSPSAYQRSYLRLEAPQGRAAVMLDARNVAPKDTFLLVTPKEIGMSPFPQLNEGHPCPSIRTHQTWCWPYSAPTNIDMIQGHHQQGSIRMTINEEESHSFAPLQGRQEEASSPFVPNRMGTLHISMTSSSPSPSSTPSIMASSPRRRRLSSINMVSSPVDDAFDEEVAQAMMSPPPPLSHATSGVVSLKPRRSMRTIFNDGSFLFWRIMHTNTLQKIP